MRVGYPGRDRRRRWRGSRALLVAFCASPLAARLAALDGARREPPFTFEHEGVLLHGHLDVVHRDGGRALVVDYKTNALGDADPAEIVDADYRLQRLVYALACLRAGADEVEVVYQFLERPDEPVARDVHERRRRRARGGADGGRGRDRGRGVPPVAGRAHLRRLPGAGRRLRGPAAAVGGTAGDGRRRVATVAALRVAALYDIHGNLPALEAVLAELEGERIDAYVIGGDTTAGRCRPSLDCSVVPRASAGARPTSSAGTATA